MEIRVTIQGTTPLLMGAMSDAAQLQVESGVSATGNKKMTPREAAQLREYRDIVTGKLCIPGTNIAACIRGAGKFHKLNGAKITTTKGSIMTGAVRVIEPACIIDPQKYEVDTRGAVIPKTGSAIIRHRPRFDKWKLSFTLYVVTRLFSPALVRTLIDDAGLMIGIGDYRPERKGVFGCFNVTSWKEEG